MVTKVFAYCYSDPLLETVPNAADWGDRVDAIYLDRGDRQQWQQLVADCRQHLANTDYAGIDYVVVQRLEDLGDTGADVSDRLAELEALAIPVKILSPAGHAPLPPSQQLRQLQSLQDSQRGRQLRLGHARNRINALPPPGKAPYGYRRGKDRYILDRSTAPVVKEFFEHFLLYGSLRASVRHLQKKYNKTISVSTGQRWLTSPVYRGDLDYHTGDVVPNTHAPIISRDEAAQVDRLLRRNRRMSPRSASAPRSLSGLVMCDRCQAPLTVSPVRSGGQDYLYLRPTACSQQPKCAAIAYGQVLERTIDQVCHDLPRAVAAAPMPDMDGIKQGITAQISAKQAVLQQLPDLVLAGILDDETAALRAQTVRTEVAVLQAKLAQLPPANLRAIAQTVSLPQFWLDLSEVERRFYFREFIRQIRIVRQERDWQIRLVFIF